MTHNGKESHKKSDKGGRDRSRVYGAQTSTVSV